MIAAHIAIVHFGPVHVSKVLFWECDGVPGRQATAPLASLPAHWPPPGGARGMTLGHGAPGVSEGG